MAIEKVNEMMDHERHQLLTDHSRGRIEAFIEVRRMLLNLKDYSKLDSSRTVERPVKPLNVQCSCHGFRSAICPIHGVW